MLFLLQIVVNMGAEEAVMMMMVMIIHENGDEDEDDVAHLVVVDRRAEEGRRSGDKVVGSGWGVKMIKIIILMMTTMKL